MVFKTIREFHWITKTVMILAAVPFVLMFIAIVAQIAGLSYLSAGIGILMFALTSVLVQVLFFVLVIVAVYMIISAVKGWIEKYLDAMLAKLDLLVQHKSEQEKSEAFLMAMNGKVERMEKKLEGIEEILQKVSE